MAQEVKQRPPFRADHVGSLLRPGVLRDAFRRHAQGDLPDADFTQAQDDAIRDVVRLQEDVGLEVVTDGEFRRSSYWGRFVERCNGFVIRPAVFKFRDDHGHEVDFTATYAAARLARTQPLATDEFQFLHRIAKVTPKITMPAPSTMHFYRCTDFADPKIYADAETFFADLVQIYRQEIADLSNAGCRYIQFDEVAVAMLCDPAIRERIAGAGQDPDRLVDLYIKAINDCVAGAPAGMMIGVHMCRGNFRGRYLSEGGYESVAERFFAGTAATHFLLEYDTARAGDFKPLRFVPQAKGVVLGLVSTKTPVLETIDDLKRRTGEAAKVIALDRLGLGPQCGFASTAAGNPLTEADERAKLRLLVEAADAIWG
ncbi:MAG: 5-methyltetrahydropteroyltriglutamate--homocysteine S-methyltransferase [Hyphomonadaceae bacterium]|jgi:5-methyltetrahydropteroyltriglutamate--homocysteine methyltransferase|nr:5-methyltetrahydropteroyltriglutamate--homocysteine S-methyltransferase [Hyphomonadaceae bacterium]